MAVLRRRLLGPALVVALLASTTACAQGRSTPSYVSDEPGLVRPGTVHAEKGADPDRVRAVVLTARRLYTFWSTGRTRYLDQAVTDDFQDRTLPAGRPQGPQGPRAASKAFRAAVPDLSCELADLYVTGDTFTARLVFRGHFTGTFQGTKGRGQEVRFDAIDIQHANGPGHRITEDWHLEDNLTFMQQIGVLAP